MSLWAAITDLLLNKAPPFKIVFPDQQAIRLTLGKYKKTYDAGFYWKWPLFEEIHTVRVKDQPINLPNQSLENKDGSALAVSGVIRYEVEDARKALLDVLDYDTSLQNLAMGAIGEYISLSNNDDCGYSAICKEVMEELEVEARDWGLNIISFKLTDLVKHRVIRLMTHDTPVEPPT